LFLFNNIKWEKITMKKAVLENHNTLRRRRKEAKKILM
jgi:hypothetical protein